MMKKIYPDFLSDTAFLAYTKSDFCVWLNFDEIGSDGYMIFYISDNQQSAPYYVGMQRDVEDFFLSLREPLIY